MIIKYENTLEDYLAFNLFHHKNSPGEKRRLMMYRFFIPLLWIVLLIPTIIDNLLASIILLLPICLLWIIFIPKITRFGVNRHAKKLVQEGKNKGLLGKHKISLSQDSILEESETGLSKTTWNGIERVAKNLDFIFIYVGALQAHIIPRRAFVSQNEFEDFYNEASHLWQKATS